VIWTLARTEDWGPDPMQLRRRGADPLEYSQSGGIAMNAAELKQLIDKGEYEVDPVAVADAMLRRLRAPQNECSNPDSSPSASVNTTPGGPSTTKPTHVRSVPRLRRASMPAGRGPRSFSSVVAVRAGTQTHSS
jgi:hypothetical protein